MKTRIVLAQILRVVFFGWVLAPLAVFSTVLMDPVQARVALIALIWEPLVFGLCVVSFQSVPRLLQGFVNRIESGKVPTDRELRTFRKLVLTYPFRAALFCFGASAGAYGLGALQGRLLANLPWEGVWTLLILGFITGLLWSVLEYFLLDHHLRHVTGLLLARIPDLDLGRRLIPLSFKIFASSLALVAGSLGTFGLTTYARAAELVEKEVGARLTERIQEMALLSADLPPQPDGRMSDSWWALATEFRVSPRSYVQLVDRDGRIEHTHPATEQLGVEWLQDSGLLPAVQARALSSGDGFLIDRVGQPKVVAFGSIPDTPWKLVAVAPRSDFRQHLDVFRFWGLTSMGIAFVLSLVFGILCTRSITTGLAEVTRVARAMAGERDLSRRVTFFSNDEVGVLGRTFNEMAQTLQSYAEGLEHLVAERTHELRLRGEQLEAKNVELNDFVYVVSHDLRAPLINLEGFSQVLQDGMRQLSSLVGANADATAAGLKERWPELNHEMTEALGFILRSVKKMDMLARGLLELSRIQTRAQTEKEVDTAGMMEEILGTLQYQITQRGIEVSVGDLPVVHADPIRLNQVFTNLIDNAIKYMPPEGVARIEIGYVSTDDVYRFFVRDTGAGIRPEDQVKIFRLFARVGSATVAGDGVGLAAVRKIIEKHGGRIWVESEPDHGSTFWFTLPIQKTDNNERSQDDAGTRVHQDSAGGG